MWMSVKTIDFVVKVLHQMSKDEGLLGIDALFMGETFTKDDLKTIYDKFSRLDLDGNGIVDPSEFKSNPTLASNPILDRLINALDKDGDGGVSFFEFCSGLALFASGAPRDSKLEFLFKIFDNDNDGFLSEADLTSCVKLICAGKLNDDQIRDLAKYQIAKSDDDGDGMLAKEEFKKAMAKVGLESTSMF